MSLNPHSAKGQIPHTRQSPEIIVPWPLILDFLRVPLAAFAFVSAAIAIGIGFGAQNIIKNFISGWILM